MFFPRLRRHAKWMFLFLAVAFGLGFVGFGVGAGGIGVGDVFRGTGGGSGVPSASDARERISENPKDAQAFRDLATALQAGGETDEAIEALESFAALRPKNTDALRELAGLYLEQATEAQQRAQLADLRASYLATGAAIAGSIQLGGKPLDVDPISSAVSSVISEDSSAAFADVQAAVGRYVDTYRKIAAASRARRTASSSWHSRQRESGTSRRRSTPTRSSSTSRPIIRTHRMSSRSSSSCAPRSGGRVRLAPRDARSS